MRAPPEAALQPRKLRPGHASEVQQAASPRTVVYANGHMAFNASGVLLTRGVGRHSDQKMRPVLAIHAPTSCEKTPIYQMFTDAELLVLAAPTLAKNAMRAMRAMRATPRALALTPAKSPRPRSGRPAYARGSAPQARRRRAWCCAWRASH